MKVTRDRFPPGLVLVRAVGCGAVHGIVNIGEAVAAGCARRRAACGKEDTQDRFLLYLYHRWLAVAKLVQLDCL